MAMRKSPKYDLKRKYNRVLEISIIISLLLLIGAFKFTPSYDSIKSSQNEVWRPLCGFSFIETIPSTNQFSQRDILQNRDFIVSTSSNIQDRISVQQDSQQVSSAAEDDPDGPICNWGPPEKFPDLIGGIKSLQDKIEYPDSARKNNIQGMVIARAYFDEEGNVFNVEILRGIGGGCDEEAIRVLSGAKFTPVTYKGKPVKMQIAVPIRFKIDEHAKAHNQ